MKKVSIPRSLAAACGLAVMALAGAAHAADERDFYVGATLGAAAIGAKDLTVDNSRDGSGRLSAGLFGGVRIGGLPIGQGWPLYAELGYQEIAESKVFYKVGNGTTELKAKGSSIYLAAKLDAPLTERFSLYGKLGAARNKADGSTPAGQAPINIDGSKTSPLVGLGMQYAFDIGLTLRGELTSLGKASKNSEAAAVNVALAYRF